MFGIGSGEMLVFAVVVLIALGPERLPDFMRTVGKGLREVRKATSDLRKHSGIDELMRDDPAGLRALGRDISRAPAPRREQKLTAHDLAKEAPSEGVDIAHAHHLAKKNAAAAKEGAAACESAVTSAIDSGAVSVGATVAIEQPNAPVGFEGDTVPDKATMASPPVPHEPTMMGIPAVDPYALPASKSAPSHKKTLEGLPLPPATKESGAPSASSPSAPPPRSSARPSVPPPPPRPSAPPPVPVTRRAPPPPPPIETSPSRKRPSLAPSIPPAPSLSPSVPPPASAPPASAPPASAPTPTPTGIRETTMAIEVEDLTLDES